MALKIGVVGTGFARSFIPLFKAHPLVGEVVLAERIPNRLRDTAREFDIARTCASLTELCATDVDAVAIYNQTALMRTSDGGMCRINEFRRVGWGGTGNSVHLSIFGTLGSYEEQANAQVWVGLKPAETRDLTELLDCRQLPVDGPEAGVDEVLKRDFYTSISALHPVGRLPRSFAGLPNAHYGSHQFLVDDFAKSVAARRLPPNHVWNAARYCAPGLVAHESSLREGEMLPIPDFGEPPKDWAFTELDAQAG